MKNKPLNVTEINIENNTVEPNINNVLLETRNPLNLLSPIWEWRLQGTEVQLFHINILMENLIYFSPLESRMLLSFKYWGDPQLHPWGRGYNDITPPYTDQTVVTNPDEEMLQCSSHQQISAPCALCLVLIHQFIKSKSTRQQNCTTISQYWPMADQPLSSWNFAGQSERRLGIIHTTKRLTFPLWKYQNLYFLQRSEKC